MSFAQTTKIPDYTLSAWHRIPTMQDLIGFAGAKRNACIDIDGILWIEYDDGTKETAALIEYGIDNGEYKAATVLQAHARRMVPLVEAYVVLFTKAKTRNKYDPKEFDIDHFRVKRVWPAPEKNWRIMKPKEWALELLAIRDRSEKRLDEWRRNSRMRPSFEHPYGPELFYISDARPWE